MSELIDNGRQQLLTRLTVGLSSIKQQLDTVFKYTSMYVKIPLVPSIGLIHLEKAWEAVSFIHTPVLNIKRLLNTMPAHIRSPTGLTTIIYPQVSPSQILEKHTRHAKVVRKLYTAVPSRNKLQGEILDLVWATEALPYKPYEISFGYHV